MRMGFAERTLRRVLIRSFRGYDRETYVTIITYCDVAEYAHMCLRTFCP